MTRPFQILQKRRRKRKKKKRKKVTSAFFSSSRNPPNSFHAPDIPEYRVTSHELNSYNIHFPWDLSFGENPRVQAHFDLYLVGFFLSRTQ